MALSCYLFDSIVCTTLFYGYGFDLFGTLHRPLLYAIVADDLDGAAPGLPALARAVPVRPGRVALAVADLLEAPADAAEGGVRRDGDALARGRLMS